MGNDMFEKDDQRQLRRQRHFLEELARDIWTANRQIINDEIPALSRQNFMDLGRLVACRRAAYLRKSIELSEFEPGSPEAAAAFEALPALRVTYSEAKNAFAALERAIERGYIDIDMGEPSAGPEQD
ncbi:hypothetical protein [Wenzhouxiangella sp. XN24]|uniref:hypothetical protein n=1 Tax=Wenzhouxiangella sp. XN24 TaxID=2713569 RepID=UPI0013EB411A|nr:hypothetical protein [Wenzhouxiangella sp. XN24]NGX17167.1 hypothetical protein [Wenzhouxiangella sp. XN24]